MKSLIELGRRGCLLAITALAVACSGSSGGTGTTTGTGGTGNGSGGTTTGGPTCASVNQPCGAAKSCCLNLTCNAASICAQSSANGTSSGGTGTGGAPDNCPLSAAGGACVTSVECEAGLFCVDGSCAAPTPDVPNCTAPGGGAPSAAAPCCESTQDAGPEGLTCVPWDPCLTQGQNCSDGGTCCSALSCGSDGTCDAVCGAIGAVCTTDSDCCSTEGMRCIPGSTFTGQVPPILGSICYPYPPAVELTTANEYFCLDNPQCSVYDAGPHEIDCALGTFCDVGVPEDGGTDPCAVDGLVCDTQYTNLNLCRNPDLFEQCVPGGPACNQVSNTTSPVVCSDPIFGQLGDLTLCTYECDTTADCVLPWMSCLGNAADRDCVFAEQSTGCEPNTPSDLLGLCNASSISDGICLAVGGENPSNSFGLCMQAFTDGDGGPGAACNIGGNRQLGGLCDTNDLCAGNLCGSLCNAGTLGTPACGEGLTCLPIMDVGGINVGPDPAVDSYTSGACVTPCDFTMTGTCTTTSQGVATKCMPAEALGYAVKSVRDFCMAALPAAQAIPIGGDCSGSNFGAAIDPCVEGAECLGGNFGSKAICQQLCEDSAINKKGAPACPANYTCTAINYTGVTASTHTGYCQAPATDGG